ncbi:Uncharacterised protein [Mycobacteroides abscessus subsp. abscessus]|nr:Uncharacterised protein [Mycobacteroides abscessus subsp. abscessus]
MRANTIGWCRGTAASSDTADSSRSTSSRAYAKKTMRSIAQRTPGSTNSSTPSSSTAYASTIPTDSGNRWRTSTSCEATSVPTRCCTSRRSWQPTNNSNRPCPSRGRPDTTRCGSSTRCSPRRRESSNSTRSTCASPAYRVIRIGCTHRSANANCRRCTTSSAANTADWSARSLTLIPTPIRTRSPKRPQS